MILSFLKGSCLSTWKDPADFANRTWHGAELARAVLSDSLILIDDVVEEEDE